MLNQRARMALDHELLADNRVRARGGMMVHCLLFDPYNIIRVPLVMYLT